MSKPDFAALAREGCHCDEFMCGCCKRAAAAMERGWNLAVDATIAKFAALTGGDRWDHLDVVDIRAALTDGAPE